VSTTVSYSVATKVAVMVVGCVQAMLWDWGPPSDQETKVHCAPEATWGDGEPTVTVPSGSQSSAWGVECSTPPTSTWRPLGEVCKTSGNARLAFATKASNSPPENVSLYDPAVTGKSVEFVIPVMYAVPAASSARA